MSKTGHILVVDDDDDILTAARLLLQRRFADVVTCRRPDRIPDLLARHAFDVVLLDMNFGPGESSGQQGLAWLERVRAIDPDLVVVMITAHGNVDTAVEAMKRGATDFVAKPWQNEKVVATVSTAVELHRSRSEAATLRSENKALREASSSRSPEIVWQSAQMRDVFDVIDRAAPTDANVLILGENGTGKELVARALHARSARASRLFMAVDLGSVSESLFESELFGHRKGAFTDAVEDRLGRFQAADGGTLFLDEIGNVPLHLQAKLLGALEQRQVTPLGSDEPHAFDVRIIAATNSPMTKLRDEECFRQDLLFRLNTVEITIPPLRERRDDVLPIARHYAASYARKYDKPGVTFSPAAETALLGYDWPGNVRALRHAVERAVILASGSVLQPGDLQLAYDQPAPQVPPPPVLNLDEMEKDAISRALRKHGFNISRAAAELGLTRASLYRRMEKHGI